MTDMRMRPDPSNRYPGRTYRFYTGPVVYKFGYGLSYTKYSYEFVSVPKNKLFINSSTLENAVTKTGSGRYISVRELGTNSCKSMTIPVRVRASNDGEMNGKHPILLFVKTENVGNGSPTKQLVGFRTVSLSAGQTAEVEFAVSPCKHMSYANEHGIRVIEEGSHILTVEDKEYPISIVL